jgi:hypothetical protein
MKLARFCLLLLFVSPLALAQFGPPAEPKGPASPKLAAQIDITGQWVAIVSEDWVYRMVVAPKGDTGSIPINEAGKKASQDWDPAKDGHSCKAYGAAGIIRQPGRIRIGWQDDRTLKMEFDAGTQTRLLHFSTELPTLGYLSSSHRRPFVRRRMWVRAASRGIRSRRGTSKLNRAASVSAVRRCSRDNAARSQC